MFLLQVTTVAFHEHHLLADVRACDTGSRTASLRRSSSLVPLARALQQGQKTCQACLLSLSSPGMLIALLCSRPLLSHSLANCSMERMGSSNLQNLESSSVVYTEAGVSRVCVMELEVVNSADVGLQVRSGSRHGRLLST